MHDFTSLSDTDCHFSIDIVLCLSVLACCLVLHWLALQPKLLCTSFLPMQVMHLYSLAFLIGSSYFTLPQCHGVELAEFYPSNSRLLSACLDDTHCLHTCAVGYLNRLRKKFLERIPFHNSLAQSGKMTYCQLSLRRLFVVNPSIYSSHATQENEGSDEENFAWASSMQLIEEDSSQDCVSDPDLYSHDLLGKNWR